jgi:uncharacterized protein (TIGR00369 family)
MTTSPARLRALVHERDPHTVHAALGIRATSYDADAFVVEVDVSDRLLMHAGVVHGGVYVLLGESACSMCAALHVDIDRFVVAGQEINANHLRGVSQGKLVCTARPIETGGRTHVYGFEVRTEQGDLVSIGRCTIAVRER